MSALLSRCLAQQGDRTAAATWCRKAAAAAMEGRWHLCALIVGWQGGPEGRAIVDAACAAMGRSEHEILEELRQAGAEFQGGLSAESIGGQHAQHTNLSATDRLKALEKKAVT